MIKEKVVRTRKRNNEKGAGLDHARSRFFIVICDCFFPARRPVMREAIYRRWPENGERMRDERRDNAQQRAERHGPLIWVVKKRATHVSEKPRKLVERVAQRHGSR